MLPSPSLTNTRVILGTEELVDNLSPINIRNERRERSPRETAADGITQHALQLSDV
jgi:hypothetical protein